MLVVLIIVGFFVAIFLIVTLVGVLQPKTASVQRSIIINAPRAVVFPEVVNLRRLASWCAWGTRDPNMGQTFSGQDGAVGSTFYWNGNNTVGTGTMRITAIDPGTMVMKDIDFGPRGKALSTLILDDFNGATKVMWKFEPDLGSPFRSALLTPMMKRFITKDYDEGLRNLKAKLEA